MRVALLPLVLLACTVATEPPELPVADPSPAVAPPGEVATAEAAAPAAPAEPAAPGSEPAAPPAGDEGPASTSTRAATRAAMGAHDELSEFARAAIVSGDLPAFRAAVESAARAPLPGDEPERGAAYVAALRAAASAPDLTAAAASLGRIGEACAACHRQHPAGRFPPSGYPDGDADVLDRMQRHWWGVQAMWQGLVGPSVRSWEVGAKALADRGLTQMSGFPDTEPARAWATDFQRAVAVAQGVPEAERGAAFGKILVTCAACHTGTGKGPSLAEPVIER